MPGIASTFELRCSERLEGGQTRLPRDTQMAGLAVMGAHQALKAPLMMVKELFLEMPPL